MEILTESSSISPRISFSHDLTLFGVVLVEQRLHQPESPLGLNPGFEFDLGTSESFDRESCSAADELFSGGKILPTEIKKKAISPISALAAPMPGGGAEKEEQKHHWTRTQFPAPAGKEQGMKEKQQSSSSRSFWRFKRSSSLNCGSGYGRKLCPLPLLSRSNSTGSAELPLKKESHHHCQKHPPPPPPPPLKPLQAARLSNGGHHSQRPPVRRSSAAYSSSCHGHGSNGSSGSSSMRVNVNPALNVHSGNLFGLGSIIFNGKDKNRRK